jgi:hypothetical protein
VCPSPSPQTEAKCNDAKHAYDSINQTLTEEIPRLIDSRVAYVDPILQAFVRVQHKFYRDSSAALQPLTKYFGPETGEVRPPPPLPSCAAWAPPTHVRLIVFRTTCLRPLGDRGRGPRHAGAAADARPLYCEDSRPAQATRLMKPFPSTPLGERTGQADGPAGWPGGAAPDAVAPQMRFVAGTAPLPPLAARL